MLYPLSYEGHEGLPAWVVDGGENVPQRGGVFCRFGLVR